MVKLFRTYDNVVINS